MMVYGHSILYCIVLKNPVNIFDVVPDVMRKHRREILYGVKGFHPGFWKPRDDDTRDYFCVVKDPESDDRLVASQFFKERKANWFDGRHFWEILDHDLTKDIRLTEAEEALRQTFLAHELIKDNVLHDGWVEIGYTH